MKKLLIALTLVSLALLTACTNEKDIENKVTSEGTTVITERVLTENIITEKIIEEEIIEEDIIESEVYISEEYLAEIGFNSQTNNWFN